MPRKKEFEDSSYNPIAADLARDVAATGRTSVLGPAGMALAVDSGRALALVTNRAMEPAVRPPMPLPTPKAPEATITKRFILSRSEDDELNAFLVRLRQRSGAKITVSILVRAAVSLTMQAEDLIAAELNGVSFRRHPSAHDALAHGEFEDQWLRCLANALRKLPKLAWTSRSE